MTIEGDENYVSSDEEALKAGIRGALEEPEKEEKTEEENNMSSQDGNMDKQAPEWSFGLIRIVRVLVGVVVLFALIFNFAGSFDRVMANPEIGALAFAAISQFIQLEDVSRFKDIFNK